MCRGSDGRWVEGKRQQRACTRTDLPPVEWHIDVEVLRFYMGRHPDRGLAPRIDAGEIEGTWEQPGEDPDDGCPGGFQQCRLVWSLFRFYRRRTDNGDRVQNHELDACTDWLVRAAIAYLEVEEERCHGERARVRLAVTQEQLRKE